MENNQTKIIEKIRDGYTPKENTKLDELKNLNKKAVKPARVFAYTFGTIGSLVLGTGMCLAMKVIGTTLTFAMPLGIAVGLVGILVTSVNYPLYKKILASRKKKYSKKVLALSNELLNA